MPDPPQWVKQLAPLGPQGTELITRERAQSDLDVDGLANFLFTREFLERKAKILSTLRTESVFDKEQNYFEGRIERFRVALARAKRLRQLAVKHQWTKEDQEIANGLISEPGPYGLHASMFLATLREQGTPEQHEIFLRRAEAYEYIGCYAQTELGHGSNVRGLETTATWDQADQTFILHSPSLTASKWWIGSLGRTANHAIVMAQLMIDGKNYGPHPFVVQIRDLETHRLLDGRYAGDLGPKFGYNGMDNGFLLLKNVKIPHVNMLARFSRVDKQTGKYIKPSNASLVFGTLTWVRSHIVLESGSVLARGVTIAIRYATVRRQFQDRDAQGQGSETAVLNYTMVQIRLLPLLAATFALHFTGRSMMALYEANQKKMNKSQAATTTLDSRSAGPEELNPGAELLADLHATSCGLKALSSTIAAEGLEMCRRTCGGHGYSSFAGIGSWYADYLPTITWEGDNYLLTQQTSRFLLKSARAVLAKTAPNNNTTQILRHYLMRRDIGAAFDVLGRDEDLVAAFGWRSAFLTFEALRHRDEEKKTWNSLLIDFWRLSTAHSQYLIVKNFYDGLQDPATQQQLDPSTATILHKLFRLYALHTLERESSEFFSSAAVTVRQIQLARTRAVMQLLEDIRPHAVRLVDAWKFPDWQLDSSLGRDDGRVYEDLFYRASELNPLNSITVDPYPDSEVMFKEDQRGSARSKL